MELLAEAGIETPEEVEDLTKVIDKETGKVRGFAASRSCRFCLCFLFFCPGSVVAVVGVPDAIRLVGFCFCPSLHWLSCTA